MEASQRQRLWFAGLFLALLAAYSNHFGNGFHFDDLHSIVDNPAIRSLSNIPSFFGDAKTFSADPEHQIYRPMITASLAIDYALGGSVEPFWFHLSTYVWFMVQLVLMYILYMDVLERTSPDRQNWWLAWLAVAIYGLHPVSAETVNYVIQRGDLYATLGVVAGVVVYAWKPDLRPYGIYLLPALAGMLSKPSALIFAPILLAYILLIDRARNGDPRQPVPAAAPGRNARRKASIPAAPAIQESLVSRARRSIPAFVLCAAFWYFQKIMTGTSVIYTKLSSFDYWITQPYVTLRYVRSFFLPLYLAADTDLLAFRSLWNAAALAGCAFCALLIVAAIFTAGRPEWRAVSFGLWWFLIGLIPTAVFPLQEVENDHRMFLPFVGLSLAVVGAAGILLRRTTGALLYSLVGASLAVLAAFAWGTHRRNAVWRTEETLWRDVTEKSPHDPRGHFTLAAALEKVPGRMPEAISEYQAAVRTKPDYFEAYNNLAVALAKIPGRMPEAISEYQAALRIKPDSAELHNNLGAALATIPGRLPEAAAEYQEAVRLRPDFPEAHYNLGNILVGIPGRLPEAIDHFEAVLRVRPTPELRSLVERLRTLADGHGGQ